MFKYVQLLLVGVVCFLIGSLAAPPLPRAQVPKGTKGPVWNYGLDLKCRKGGESEFTKETRKFGVEVFRDENNGNLIYISETGSIAVIASK